MPLYDIAYSAHANGHLLESKQHSIVLVTPTYPQFSRQTTQFNNRAETSCIVASAYHPLIATSSVDGVVRMGSVWRDASVRNLRFSSPICRLMQEEKTKALRMLDFILPEATKESPLFNWSPDVAATAVSWSKHINRGYLLFSTFACGLGRIDWVGESNADTAARRQQEQERAEQEAAEREDLERAARQRKVEQKQARQKAQEAKSQAAPASEAVAATTSEATPDLSMDADDSEQAAGIM